MKDVKAVVTGMGVVTSLGNSVDELWQALLEGKSGIGPVTAFDVSDYPTRIAGEVKNFDPLNYFDRKELKHTDRAQQRSITEVGDFLVYPVIQVEQM